MMVLRILHPMDPLGRKVGGAESFVKNMIRFSPSGLSIELVGTSSREVRLREWREELLAPANEVWNAPEGVPAEQLALISINLQTAYLMLKEKHFTGVFRKEKSNSRVISIRLLKNQEVKQEKYMSNQKKETE